MDNPRKAHWQALKWILIYIKGSLSWVMGYGGATADGKVEIEGFVDFDYAGCMGTRNIRRMLYPLTSQV